MTIKRCKIGSLIRDIFFVSAYTRCLFRKRKKLYYFDLPLTFSAKGPLISTSRTLVYEGVAPKDYKDDRQAALTIKYHNGSRQ